MSVLCQLLLPAFDTLVFLEEPLPFPLSLHGLGQWTTPTPLPGLQEWPQGLLLASYSLATPRS